jgi:hypothetical protein
MATAKDVITHAKKFVDEKYAEEGDNLTIMGKWYGLNGQPWCAMFVSYCFHLAKALDLIKMTGKKGFASCDAGLKAFAKAGMLVPVGQAQEGDIVFYYLYNRKSFEDYLYKSLKFDRPQTSRHKYGDIYEEDGNSYIIIFYLPFYFH